MTDNSILKRQQEESLQDYHIRLFENKHTYNLSSEEIANLLNMESDEDYSESKWRKDYSQYLKWKDYLIDKNLDKEILDKYEALRIESEKEKIRKQDQNREYRKKIANEARFEAIRDDIINAVEGLNKIKPLIQDNIDHLSPSNKEGIVLFSDWHYGMEIDNRINKFNHDVFLQRVNKLIDKTIEYGRLNNISKLHVANLGDLLSGLIHVSTRVQSNRDVVEQITFVSETLAECLVKLSESFRDIVFYNICGNHSRIIANKNDVGIKENFENLIPWFLEARLKGINNIEIINEQDGIAEAIVMNKKVVFVHGDFDSPQNSYAKLSQLLGYVPDYIMSGYIHHHFEKEFGATTAIVNGSLVGADDYAMKGRFASKPSQKFLVIDEEQGLECTYQIKL